MTDDQIRQLTDTIYRALFNADGAALRIRLGLPPVVAGSNSEDDLRDQMGDLAIETLSRIEDEMATWMQANPDQRYSQAAAQTRIVALRHAGLAKNRARWDKIDLLTGKSKDEKC